MGDNMEKMREIIERERAYLNQLAEKNLNSEETLRQSRNMDELVLELYKCSNV